MRTTTIGHSIASPVVTASALILVSVGIGGCDRTPPSQPAGGRPIKPQPTSLETARTALEQGRFEAAQQAVNERLLARPEDPVALELAGDIAVAKQDAAAAIGLYQSATDVAESSPASLYEKLGRQQMNAGMPYQAADTLRRSIAAHPDNAKVRADYAGLVASLGMVSEAAEHLRWLLRRGRGGLSELIMLANLNQPQSDTAICEYALEQNPQDRRPLFPLALLDIEQGKWESAQQRLAEVTASDPDFAPAWAGLGRVLVERGQLDQVPRWQTSAPAAAQQWADYWIAAGRLAEQRQDATAAAAAFLQAVMIDNDHAEGLSRLATSLAQTGRPKRAATVAARARDVAAMHDAVESFLSWRKNSQQAALQVADALNRLGRPWEAEAWARVSLAMTQQPVTDAAAKHRTLFDALASDTPWQLPTAIIPRQVDLSDLPEFRWALADANPQIASVADLSQSEIAFRDEADSRGLNHICAIDKANPAAGIPIYHSTAGGVGVIDFDLDGWPDLYLTMLDGTPLEVDSSPNRLYRNLAGKLSDVTHPSATGDRGFAQGVAVGDYNSDGFADLLVANIGANRLLRNNGDGTFEDVSELVGLTGRRWTTSVAIADLDGDGRADIFEVNYCGDKSAFSQLCIDQKLQQPRSCSPLVFAAERDRIWQVQADGSVADRSDTWMAETTTGHGLGLVVGQLDQRGGLDVYVANDMTANHYWSAVDAGDDIIRFEDSATVRGLAVSGRSQSQASMGIAIGDADSDQDFDLFLTHFTDDYNTFYEQVSPGTWSDQSLRLGLAEPSDAMLAFGTQFFDADNNGSLELMIANGNVDDFSHQGHPLRMLPQFFLRQPDGRWQQGDRGQLGPYFKTPKVGRAMATVDIDRDRRTDAVITHLFDPVAVLANRTSAAGQSIRVFLQGVQSHRDAIGTVMEADVDGHRRTIPLTAGDGFQSSNQRCLCLGLGTAASAENVVLRWPSGNEQSIGTLPAGRDYLITEGDPIPWELP